MSDKTRHGLATPHGYNTPHRFPSEVASNIDILRDLSIQLYPSGRVWYRPERGPFDKFHDAINQSFARLIEDSSLSLDKMFPDNDNFNEDDATLWEYRLGLITNETVSLDLRKDAIRRKMGYPNNVKARQHPFFIERQLQLAGFDVYVHENLPPYQTPSDIIALSLNETQHGGVAQHGNGTAHGGDNFDVIANSIDQVENYSIGGVSNLWATFFIGGENLGDLAEVPQSRLREFKELVIKLKPAHLVAFTFINYV